MAKYKYPATSPYADTAQTSWYLLPMKVRSIRPHGTDTKTIITPSHEYRPDLLSYNLYGSPAYWWIFSTRNINVIRDPIWDFKSGLEIWTPTRARINELLG